MELNISVSYLGAVANYKVISEHQYLFHAQLLSYDGSLDYSPPPANLVLVKGVRCWLGSFDQQGFINELGNAIEAKMQSEDFISPPTTHNAHLSNKFL